MLILAWTRADGVERMKVNIGPYTTWIGPYQIAEKILFWMDKDEDDRVHKFGEWLAGKKNDSLLAKICGWIESKKKRRIKVRIDRYDTWSMDHTLALIILPMLKKLKTEKHGSPYVDQADLPEELRLSKREQKVHEEGYWNKKLKATEAEQKAANEKFHAQWDWVIDQMIWSFEAKLDDNDWKNYYDPYLPDEPTEKSNITVIEDDGTERTEDWLFSEELSRSMGKYNSEKYKAYEARKQLGFTLFGKYYQSLWD